MKIIGRDNYDRETVSDFLVAENITNEKLGNIMIKALNEKESPTWYMLVPDDTELYKFEP